MPDTLTTTLDLRFPQKVGGYGKVGLITGVVNISSYSQTKSALSAITGLFRTIYRVVVDGVSANGYILRWDPSANAFRAYPGFSGLGTPPAATTIALGASPATYTNADSSPERVILTGGTVSSITVTRGGFTSAALFTSTPATVRLDVGDSLTVTYSVIPTVVEKLLSAPVVGAALVEAGNGVNIGAFNFIAVGLIATGG